MTDYSGVCLSCQGPCQKQATRCLSCYNHTRLATRETLAARFWSKVDRDETGCWTWLGAKTALKYGQIELDGRSIYAHRVSWELANGPIPSGLQVLHRCDNPPCVRPDHLFLGTQRDNITDMANKGRASHAGFALRWIRKDAA